ncbi:MAG: DesA family fatty acid desaturase [Candidatus Methylumidiphilus sp.]
MATGLLSLSIWQLVGVGLVLTHITIASVTIYLHRCQAHRALDLHPIMSHFFRFWLWLNTGMITKEWVAVHRKHHAKCETVGDPHSPIILGIGKVLGEGAELYNAAAQDAGSVDKYGFGTPNDWLENKLYNPRRSWGIFILLVVELALFGPLGLTLWAIQMMWIPLWAAGVINGLGHYVGYRNFETRDASTNLLPIAFFIGGEELHNNHHAYPSSAKLSVRWFEFDLGWAYIRLMSMLKLAHVKRTALKSKIDWAKPTIDAETVMAVLRNRVHVLTLYSRSVIDPVLSLEIKLADAKTKKLLKKAKNLVNGKAYRPDNLIMGDLESALEASQTLATVYRFKEQLRELWTNAGVSQETRLEALREWCRLAEETRIQCLEQFALTLRGYSIIHPVY